jgi:hypothetical protein
LGERKPLEKKEFLEDRHSSELFLELEENFEAERLPKVS